MDPEILFCIVAILAIIAVVGVVAWLILRYLLKPENIQKELERQRAQNADPFEPQFTTEEIRATVMGHTCEVKLVGMKTPKAKKIFTVVFRRRMTKFYPLMCRKKCTTDSKRGRKVS